MSATGADNDNANSNSIIFAIKGYLSLQLHYREHTTKKKKKSKMKEYERSVYKTKIERKICQTSKTSNKISSELIHFDTLKME